MRAVVRDRYGSPEALRVEEVSDPSPGRGEVLVEVVAVSINLSDWECLIGSPAYARIGGLRSPAQRVLGSDIAGRVIAVGDGVSRFAPGDEVYGDHLDAKGGFAELAVVAEDELASKPAGLSFVEASAIPQAGAIAAAGVAGVEAGERVLINGAGGGSGSFAVQLAKRRGAHVTGVDNDRKLDLMRSFGADEVIDHRAEDFTRRAARYDVIVDLVAGRSVFALRRALADGGRYRWVGGTMRSLIRVTTIGNLAARLTGRRMGLLVVGQGPEHFGPVAELCAAGEVRVPIDRTVGLDDVPEALADVGAGRALGKIVVEVARTG